ncbi:type I toxin-antitoxin system SymE family toxin [Pantoea alhagi]|uniref:SymE family type I addiction module toxin n=1 Tax=Pantoea alhagi TaxID=1891675 RepID=UPI00202B67C4|nr:SymE family type I addiction module toxin [Pantoea alhagi]URQ61416.1 type I toxin-antitoxin system SymE family toxin [Pantoea alhagi]
MLISNYAETATRPSDCFSALSASLHLKGDWLKEAGFETGCPVTVRLDEGRLILTVEQLTGG